MHGQSKAKLMGQNGVILDSIAVPPFSNPNYSETSKLVYVILLLLGIGLPNISRCAICLKT